MVTTKEHVRVPQYLSEVWLMPPTVPKDLSILRQGNETSNEIVQKALGSRSIEEIRARNPDGTIETTNQVVARVLRDAADRKLSRSSLSLLLYPRS